MRKWAVGLLMVCSAVSADETLYEHLKRASPQPERPAFSDSFATELSPSFPRLESGDYLPSAINVNEELPYRGRVLIEDTLYLQLLMLSSIGVLTLMPESITSWDKEELGAKSLESRWKENVSKRPVWDKDDWAINYIGHPVSGAWYYTMARNDGMSITESALFSAMMSTLFWEYGYEAFAEVPSIQDLIFTPLGGALLGEWMYRLERRLDANGGVVLGSQAIGSISYFFLDPLGRIADGLKELLRLGGMAPEVTMSVRTYPRAHTAFPIHLSPQDPAYPGMGDYGFVITFQ